MKISKNAREKYTQICHKSSFKCSTYADIDYKIIRGVELGSVVLINGKETTYGYYRLRFVVKNNMVIDMYDSLNGKNINVSENVKQKYDRVHMKMVV